MGTVGHERSASSVPVTWTLQIGEKERRTGCSSDGAGDRAGRGTLFETLSTGVCLTHKDVP